MPYLAKGFSFLALAFALATPAPVAAQDPIRVQSNQVLVPTVVFDKQLYTQLNQMKAHHRDSYRHLVAKDSKLWEQIAVRDLTAKSFHLFEDGQEQRIQSVRLEPPSFRIVQDDLGKHPELIGSGGGVWAYADRPLEDLSVWLAWPQYVIAYVPPSSSSGSCHQIEVKVDRPNSVVWARSEYCNAKHSATDPLNGTDFGKQLEAAITSSKEDKIDLAIKVASFRNNNGSDRIYLTMQFPSTSLKHEFKGGMLHATIGALIMIYNKDGTLAARYSDFACCDYGSQEESNSILQTSETRSSEDVSLLPNRYENQFDLPPGEYEIRVVLSDGENFGRQQAALSGPKYDQNLVAMSNVVLCRRVRKLSADSSDIAAQSFESYTPLVSKGVEFTPTAQTRFHKNETLYAYFEVYDPFARPMMTTVQAHLRILDASTGKMVTDFEPVSAAPYITAGSKLIPIGRGVSLAEFSVGSYRLEVQAANAIAKKTPWQGADFTVEAAESSVPINSAANKNDVILNITAFDATGQRVTDLVAADFKVFDNDNPQTITSFKADSSQTTPGTPASTTLILFDLLNTIPRQREYIASRIVDAVQPLETDQGLYIYLITNKGELYPVRPPATPQGTVPTQKTNGAGTSETSDDQPWTRQIRPLLDQAIDVVHGFRLMDYRDEGIRAVTTFNRLAQLSDQLAKIPGPKTILWITTGVPNSIVYEYGGCRDITLSRASATYVAGKCGLECRPNPSEHKCLDYSPFLQHFSASMNESGTILSSVEVTYEGAIPRSDSGTPADTLRQLANLTGGRV